MTVGSAVLRMRARIAAVAIAGAVASLVVAAQAQAQPALRERRPDASRPFRSIHHRYLPSQNAAHFMPASAPPPASIVRTASSPAEFGEHQRDGHMTVEERRLLRQHIEDAVRELYKR